MQKIHWLEGKTDKQISDITEKFWDKLSREAYPLTYGKMRIPLSLEPFAIEVHEYAALQEKILLVISAAKKLAEKYFTDSELQKVIALDPAEARIVAASREQDFVGIVRADLFYGKSAKIVELNTDFPDGFFMHDVTSQTILQSYEQNSSKNLKLTQPSNADLFCQLLESEGIKKEDHIFIAYNTERKFIDEFALTKNVLEERGWKNVSYGPIEEVEFKGGRAFFNNQVIRATRRGSEISKLRANPVLLDNHIEAQNKYGLTIINNFKMRLLGHKSLLAALWDTRFQKYISAGEILAVKELIPETILLADVLAGQKSVQNDIQKDQWVLKPSDLTEGEGVVIGSECSHSEWSAHIEKAAKSSHGWLLQRKVEIPKENFSLYDSQTKKVHTERMNYDLDPHIVLFKNEIKMGNILVRFSPSEILNVMKGGGITYAFTK